jgi:hypothetical protein
VTASDDDAIDIRKLFLFEERPRRVVDAEYSERMNLLAGPSDAIDGGLDGLGVGRV